MGQPPKYNAVWNPNDGPEPPGFNGKPIQAHNSQPGAVWNPNDGREPYKFKATQSTNTNSNNNHDPSSAPPPSYETTVGPNIALNTDFMLHRPTRLLFEGHTTSNDFTITDTTEVNHTTTTSDTATNNNATTLFNVTSSTFSPTHDMTIIHHPTNTTLFTIEKKPFSTSYRYTATIPNTSTQLFTTETPPTFFSSGTTTMTFRNAVTSAQDNLQVQLHRASGPSEVLYRNQRIMDIHEMGFSFRPSYVVDILVPGVDSLIAVALVLVANDRWKSQKNNRNSRRAAAMNH